MAADTAPAAVPGPDEPAGSATPTGPLTGMLASMLTPVDPARPARSQPASVLAEDAPESSVAGGSSAEYHGSKEESDSDGSGRNSRQRQGVLRAWLLAGAARWAKGAGANIKRLEVAKAKAQAQQVKEARRVTVNRSDGMFGKTPSRFGATDKSLNRKGSSDGPRKGPKNSSDTKHVNTRQGSAGRSGNGTGAGSSPGKMTEPKTPKPSKPSKGNDSKAPAPGSGSTGKAGVAGRDGKNGTGGAAPKDSNRNSTGGKQDKTGKSPNSKDTAAPKDKPGKRQDSGTSSTVGPKNRQGKDGDAGRAGKNGAPGTAPDRVSLAKKDKAAGAKQDTEAKDDKAGRTTEKTGAGKDAKSRKDTGAGTGKDTNTKAGQQDKTRTNTQAPADGKPFSTRESREAGYRDGTRAAKAAAHVRAYRDGVKDGWGDTTEIADREKVRLDKAHEERKQSKTRTQPPAPPSPTVPPEPKEKPNVPKTAPAQTQQPLTPPPDGINFEPPIRVRNIDATHLELGTGAARQHISRGEVRSLKAFERKLADKACKMNDFAEGAKALKAHAGAQSKRATYLLEAARAVEGGGRLIAELTKLQDAANTQVGEAEELQKRSVRAAEACSVLFTNVHTRYGDMYRAVVNSPETVPAELAFYKG